MRDIIGRSYIKKDFFFHVIVSMGQKKILSPHEESNPRPSDSMLLCSTTEPQRLHSEQVYYEVHMTHILHTARVSNVDSVMFVDRNKRDGKF